MHTKHVWPHGPILKQKPFWKQDSLLITLAPCRTIQIKVVPLRINLAQEIGHSSPYTTFVCVRTGPEDCSSGCFFALEDGSMTQAGQIITNTASSTTVTVAGLNCSVSILAVGGGGGGGFGGDTYGGGGGSGQVNWREIVLTPNNMSLVISVGDGGEATVVRGDEGEVLVEAKPGSGGGGNDGGSGYSGGGGWGRSGGGQGGVNGGDGEHGNEGGNGGGGQGEILSSIVMQDFVLR